MQPTAGDLRTALVGGDVRTPIWEIENSDISEGASFELGRVWANSSLNCPPSEVDEPPGLSFHERPSFLFFSFFTANLVAKIWR